ncbi:MFS transporter [Bacillus sp. AFS077874]|uniref:MFS transporter n=1 Tax=unclassified Bacillus (in: firmicutes) TaxID=185979 RepID=UPI000BEE2D96|nr:MULTISPECIES: MFS transporter [unclassified Bacillus (in: firmicutes)]PEC50946.1 MFS transporter [Bacillus sp. AFS096315]PFM83262.1 MFS transporter [Bacillus sp. AFS077874]
MSNNLSSVQRWLGVCAILVVVIISYVDRINVSILITNHDFISVFGIANDRVAQGQLMTLFLIGYGIAAFFLTPVYESFLSVRNGLLISILLWALFTLISPFASTLFLFLFFRAVLGISEGPLFSLKTMYINDTFKKNERGKPNAVSSMGVSIGLSIGFPFITFLIYQFSWESSFYVLSFLNILIGLPLILFFIRKTGKNNRNIVATKSEGSKKHNQLFSTMSTAFKTPGLIWILIIEIVTLSYLWGSSAWLPSYLLQEKHFSLKQMGFVASLPFIVSIGTGFLGGYIIDRLPTRKLTLLFVVGGVGTALSMTIAIISPNTIITAIGLILANGFWGIQGPAIPTMVQNLSDTKSVGSTYGIINGIGNLVSAFMPAIMGAIIGNLGGNNFVGGFYLLVGTQIITAVCGLFFLVYKKDLLIIKDKIITNS